MKRQQPLVKIDLWFVSSKTCSVCHRKQAEMPLNIRVWRCEYGAQHHRDINAALNILHQGIMKLKAEGLSVSVSANGGKHKSGVGPVAA